MTKAFYEKMIQDARRFRSSIAVFWFNNGILRCANKDPEVSREEYRELKMLVDAINVDMEGF